MGGNRELAERFIASLEARDWDVWAELLHPAVVYEIPQSRERIRGRDRYLRFNQEYPGDWHLRPKVTIADERHGVVWFEWLLDGRTDDAMAFFEFADGLITRVTDFWPEPYEPPPGREHLVERWLPAPRSSSRRSRGRGYLPALTAASRGALSEAPIVTAPIVTLDNKAPMAIPVYRAHCPAGRRALVGVVGTRADHADPAFRRGCCRQSKDACCRWVMRPGLAGLCPRHHTNE
jgi:hypothetical protein